MNQRFVFPRAGAHNGVAPGVRRYVFLLLDGHCQLSFNAALEALSLANGFGPVSRFEWLILSETGRPVINSNGGFTAIHGGLQELNRRDIVIVCGGTSIAHATSAAVIGWLRRERRRGVVCGALVGAVFSLAAAGLLRGREAAVHWEIENAFVESFPDVSLSGSIFVDDMECFTCVGRAATIDLILHLIAKDAGDRVSADVSDRMVYTNALPIRKNQRLSLQALIGKRLTKLEAAVRLIEDNLETPLSPSEIADQVGISTRQLERLFKVNLRTTPNAFYMKKRLIKARELLLHTDMQLIEVACACGFNTQAYFSKRYRMEFGVPPSEDTGRSLAVAN